MINTEILAALKDNSAADYLTDPKKTIFFDIETTGLHRKYSRLYLIGVLYYKNSTWHLHQWFAQKPADEPEILQAFLNFISDYNHIIHYNGTSFDLPYLRAKCAYYGLDHTFDKDLKSVDIYRRIKPLQMFLNMKHLTQKDAENFMGIHREDPFIGTDLIELYQEYLQTADTRLLQMLLLHNREDVLNMLSILPMLSYTFLFDNCTSVTTVRQNDDMLHFTIPLKYSLPKPIECRYESYFLKASKNTAVLSVNLYRGTLKYFYPNPKDYYYLPDEDSAIHKSIGVYVDKDHRRQAIASNCYQKQEGIYAPQYGTVILPSLKQEYKDHISYFPCHKGALLPENWELLYSCHILDVLKQYIK